MSQPDTAYNGQLIESLLNLGDRIFDSYFPKPQIRSCQWESLESVYGGCDGEICHQPATVYSLITHQELCKYHYRSVSR